jgi:MarR family transcriptional regulator for hemolysin
MARRVASQHGVSEAASAPLIWIERLGGNVRQNTRADAVGIEGASLVRLIDELQASGLITRVPDPTDRRANAISLTDRGRTVVKAVNTSLNDLRAETFANTTQADLEAALLVLQQLKAAAGEPSPKPFES